MQSDQPSDYLQRTCEGLLGDADLRRRGESAVPCLAKWLRGADTLSAAVSLELAEMLIRFLHNELQRPRDRMNHIERTGHIESRAVRVEALALRLEAVLTRAAVRDARRHAQRLRDAAMQLRAEALGGRNGQPRRLFRAGAAAAA